MTAGGFQNFGWTDGGSSQFSHDDAGGKVGELSRNKSREPSSQPGGQEGNSGIARPGNIVDLASPTGDTMRLVSGLEKDHAVFTQGQKQVLAGPVHQEFLPDGDPILGLQGVREPKGSEGLEPIGFTKVAPRQSRGLWTLGSTAEGIP